MKKKLLIIDHSAVVDLYRERERILNSKYDYKVSMIIPEKWNEGGREVILNDNESFKVYKSKTFLTNNVPLFIYNPLTIIKAFISEKADIIDIHEEPYSLAALEIILLKKIFSPKSKIVFYSAQNILKKYPLFIRKSEKFVCSNSEAAYTCSSEVTSVLKNRSFSKVIKEIPLGIDSKIFYPMCLNKDSNEFVIGFIGRLEESKGVLDLINSLKLISSINWKCVIVGDGSIKCKIESNIVQSKINNRVSMVGSVEASKIAEYINIMDVIVVPSRTTDSWKEQFGRVIIEAFSCGKPVIGSNSGAIPEVISTGGMIYNEGNIVELKECIESLINDKNLYENLKRNALEEAKKYNWENIAEKFDDLYKKII